ncbi:MAG: isochorismate synthase [Myxococcales bacterium]|nr:isochorismate synthase [Myxococcales bacterium]
MKPAADLVGPESYAFDVSHGRAPEARRSSDDAAVLDSGLAAARQANGLTAIAFPAPIVAASAIIAAWRAAPAVAWSSRDLTIVGIGVAHELRGSGQARCDEIVAGARRLAIGEVIVSAAVAKGDRKLALARPRLLGGLAFTPGAADSAPWTGFGDAWFMLPRWTYVQDGASAWLVLAVDARDARDAKRWHDELAAFRVALANHFAARPQPPMIEIDRGDVCAWRDQVREITNAIARGECEKVVAARSAVVTLGGEARAADLLAELDARHEDCVRLLVRPPAGGTLIAATPERLVRVDGSTVACDALAGSRARIDNADHAALLASTKDHREHELVVRAIASTLAELGDVRVPEAPGIRALRHVLHLHTPITAKLRSPHHVLEIAARLHPTPAVGGTPTQFATEWIGSRETSQRGWYASPVGWFDLEGNGELAVAIRSGVLIGEHAHLWAGAGIVAGSDADRELAETELKLRAMLGALGAAA